MFAGLGSFGKMLWAKKKLTFTFLVLISWMFLIANVSWLFGTYAIEAKQTLDFYFMFLVLGLVFFNVGMPEIDFNMKQLVLFFGALIATFIGFTQIAPYITSSVAGFEGVKTAASFGILYAFVKAFPEEIIFRWLLPIKAGIGMIASNIFFGLFHASVLFGRAQGMVAAGTLQASGVYPFVLTGALWLTGLGFIWAIMAWKSKSLMASTGSHLGYNMAVMGIGGATLGFLM